MILKDRVPTTRLYRTWVVPGLTDPDNDALEVRRGRGSAGSPVPGSRKPWSGASNWRSRRRLMSRACANDRQFEVLVDVKPGADAVAAWNKARRAHRRLSSRAVRTPAEIDRVVVGTTLSTVSGLPDRRRKGVDVGGRRALLA